ncbi:SIT4-associating protein/190 [Kwoniella heveanensis BCC8398]|uniref:SIT4-associating protein/190 n=1 Tax=Kwoniella heveanensis BCC8398 TaxID=1296120 RepID=A0A1B9GKR6_9TREE|nr:SIT4-associating protein/190 [Kwoniella heveanensis BCC8398]
MLWRFGFASSSTLDALLTREVPPTIEELLDEQDILNECKAQNNKLVSYLAREDSVKSLLQWVIAGLDELDQAALDADTECLSQALSSPDLYPSYRAPQPLVIPGTGPNSPPLEPAKMMDVDLDEKDSGASKDGDSTGIADETREEEFNRAEIGLGRGLRRKSEGEDDIHGSKYPNTSMEILCCAELWSVSETIIKHADHLLTPFWDAVLPPIDPNSPTNAEGIMASSMTMSRQEAGERERARNEFWSDKDEERDRRREIIRGMWMRVNGALMTKRTPEMIRFIRSLPNIVDRLVARIASPAVQDILVRIVSSEEGGVTGVMDWLADEGLIPKLLEYLSPHYSTSVHTTVGEVLKSIITLCAPTPFNPHGGNAMEQQAGQGVQPSGTRDNKLIRELVSEQSVETLIGFMLDNVELTDLQWDGVNGSEGDTAPIDPFIVHPLPSVASATSSLTHICSILVEVIRRNNSDFSEPHLFHTLRNRLMSVRVPATQPHFNGNGNGDSNGDNNETETEQEKEKKERRHMEDALADMSSKMGIVHLGHLLNLVSERFDQLHQFVLNPRSQARSASIASPKPFTLERYRIIELYAELLHSSNMSILNRTPGTGPTYTEDGILSGGLEGLEALGEAIDGDHVGEEDRPEEDQVTQARELPISSAGSTDASLNGSDDVGSDDEEMLENIDEETTPAHLPVASKVIDSATSAPSSTSTLEIPTIVPPPPSDEDAERLRNVLETESRPPVGTAASDIGAASNAAVATSTAAPSIASDILDTETGEEAEAGDDTESTPTPVVSTKELEVDPLDTAEVSRIPPVPSPLTIRIDPPFAPGDRLKSMYVAHHVIPTVVDLFFEYPNNDFMHHVVYDILQQILNGRLGPGLNRELVVELIKEARLVERVLDAQRLNDRMVSQPRTPRLAYMGHVVLIAEELVKFFARCPPELYELIKDSFVLSEWEAFVDTSLSEAKARDTRPLAGGKPMINPADSASEEGSSLGPGPSQRDDDSSSDDDDDGDQAVKFGEPLTRTQAADGFAHRGEFDAYADQEGDEEGMDRFWRNSGVGLNRRAMDSSDDDDDDADWLRPNVNSGWGNSGGNDDDDFGAWEAAPGPNRHNDRDDFDDDDGWGSFNAAASPFESPDPNAENPFGDDNFAPSVVRAEPVMQREEPLTPRDWAEQFERAFREDGAGGQAQPQTQGQSRGAAGAGFGGNDEDVPAIVMPSLDEDEDDEEDEDGQGGRRMSMSAGTSSWTFAGDDEGVDLPPTMSPTLPQQENDTAKVDVAPASPPQLPSSVEGSSSPSQHQPILSTSPKVVAPGPAAGTTSADEAVQLASPVSPSARRKSLTISTSPTTSPKVKATNPIPIPRRQSSHGHELGRHHSHPGHPDSASASASSASSRSSTSPISPSSRRWGEAFSPPDPSLIAAATEESPLGPGVSPDTHITNDGLLEREVGGKMIRVPQDEIVEAIERKADDDEDALDMSAGMDVEVEK